MPDTFARQPACTTSTFLISVTDSNSIFAPGDSSTSLYHFGSEACISTKAPGVQFGSRKNGPSHVGLERLRLFGEAERDIFEEATLT
jgi:hypothetical protein